MTPSSRRKLGLSFMIIPPVCIVAAPFLFTILNFVFSLLATLEGAGTVVLIARLVNVLLGFVGIVGLVGIFTLFPIGLYLFFSTPKEGVPPQSRTS